ncbi:hypothetical protein KKD19_02175 [Patescibacteria group bacterium]|nr:hypothetical protein [Patescibacteria group bacterium]MCG2693191.1 hypothetical protein [Candidatus Parcubacteria bacterium]
MPDTNINQIKQAEEEAQKIIRTAHKEVEQNINTIKDQMKNTMSLAEDKVKPTHKKLEKETDKAIQEYEKIAYEEQKIVLEKLEDMDNVRIEKAINLVMHHLTQQ